MKTIFKLKITFLFLTIYSLNGCTGDIDGLRNNNDPNEAEVLATGSDLPGVIAGGFISWWQAGNRETLPALAVAGDIATCSWGNFGMRILSNEPRNSIPNSTSWSDSNVIKQPWEGYYASAAAASKVIKAIKRGVKYEIKDIDETNSLLASAYFLRGISEGYLGMLFDKSILVDENTTGDYKVLTPYKDMLTSSIADLKKAIELSNSNTFKLPAYFINEYPLDNIKLAKLANSYAARFIVQGARTQAETNAIDWSIVKSFAENGISDDFGPRGDNGINWWSDVSVLSNSPNGFEETGGRLDMRIVNLLDPNQPKFYPAAALIPVAKQTINTTDNRLNTDFEFVSRVYFKPERGLFHSSHCISQRYLTDSDFSDGSDKKRLITFSKADNDLLLAEANTRLNSLPVAISLINAGTRITRGKLSPLSNSATKTEILDAIFYERYVELFNTGLGSGFFDRRRTDQLQKGTFRHFPIPAKVLEVIQEKLYTFGGAKNDPTGMVPHYDIENNPSRTDDTNIPTLN
jgi:starch-binding outer membrane protein, SusD/RagB family